MTREWRKLQNPYLVYCKHFESYSALEQIKVNTLVVFVVRSVWDHFSTHCWFESILGYAFILGLFCFLLSCVLTILTIFRSYFQGGGEEKSVSTPWRHVGIVERRWVEASGKFQPWRFTPGGGTPVPVGRWFGVGSSAGRDFRRKR
jgi:hypothetical protein